MINNLHKQVKEIESHGRHGDTILVHMKPAEVQLLEHFAGEKMTINPDTGLPEAFSLWKTLLGIAGLAAAPFTAGITAPVGMALFGAGMKPDDSQTDADKWQAAHDAAIAKNQYIFSNQGKPTPLGQSAPDVLGMQKPYFSNVAGGGPSPLQESTLGKAKGGRLEPEQAAARRVAQNAILALQGHGNNPEESLNEYIAHYGPQALSELHRSMGGQMPDSMGIGGMVKGPGSGLDDMATAKMNDGRDVLLSPDEFIIPADVVSHIGNGSSEAGARQLHAMMDRVRMKKTGTVKQAGKLNPKKMMPA